MTTGAGLVATGEEYLGSLILLITESLIPELAPGVYEITETLLIGKDGSGVKTFRIEFGTVGESDSTEDVCSELTCAGSKLVCDGVVIGDCIVTGSFGG